MTPEAPPVCRVVYVANARLPTEKAHGYQICKMCEAFARRGKNVLLIHPRRRQCDRSLGERTIFEYYGVAPVFEIAPLANVDVVPLSSWMPQAMSASLFFAHAFVWSGWAAQFARRMKADLYYTREAEAAYWLTRLKLPTVYEAHVVPMRGNRALLRRVFRSPVLKLTIALTSSIKKGFEHIGFASEGIVVLPDGVDAAWLTIAEARDECRRRLGLPHDRVVAGYIGRFQTMGAEKGIPELIEAAARLPSLDGREVLVLCVGGPMDAVPAYRALARRLDISEHRLRFVDRVPNAAVPDWIRACDVVVIPSPPSTFFAHYSSPLKLFEYMAAGVPIVASDLPSIRDILRHGENAWLVAPGDVSALADGLTRVLRDHSLGNRLAARAREEVREYTWDRRVAKVLARLSATAS